VRKFIELILLALASCAPAAGQPAKEPGSTFKAVLHQTNGGLPRGALYGDFTSEGPVANTLVPLPDNVGEVVSDSTGKLLFAMGGHELYQLDLANKKATRIVAKGVPEISWAMGLSYDTKRQRVLMATLGGEGFLYAYDPKSEAWSVVGSLNNVDVTAIAYLESLDRVFAIASDRAGDGEEARAILYEYDAESGKPIQHRSIDLPIVGDFIDRALQLIPFNDSLVFVQMPKSAQGAGLPIIHVVDPKTAEVKKNEE
jgi:hypothetical protein